VNVPHLQSGKEAIGMRSTLLFAHAPAFLSQWLPDTPHRTLEEHMAPTYAGERCAFYHVRRLQTTSQQRQWMPRLGWLSLRSPDLPNLTLSDGYGTSRQQKLIPCREDGDNRAWQHPDGWSVLLCAPVMLAPLAPPGGASSSLSVLLVSSDHNNHGFFAQVERVLNQLHTADTLGLVPFVYLGRKVAAAPDACGIGENQYFEPSRGPNVWEYYFEPVSTYTLGAPTFHGRPVKLLITPAEDARRHCIRESRDAVTSYFEFKR